MGVRKYLKRANVEYEWQKWGLAALQMGCRQPEESEGMMAKVKLSDIRVEGSTYRCSLSKLVGKQIVDVQGYIVKEDGDLSFKLTNIAFEDGTELGVEGEHDFPYCIGDQPNFDEETLQALYDEDLP